MCTQVSPEWNRSKQWRASSSPPISCFRRQTSRLTCRWDVVALRLFFVFSVHAPSDVTLRLTTRLGCLAVDDIAVSGPGLPASSFRLGVDPSTVIDRHLNMTAALRAGYPPRDAMQATPRAVDLSAQVRQLAENFTGRAGAPIALGAHHGDELVVPEKDRHHRGIPGIPRPVVRDLDDVRLSLVARGLPKRVGDDLPCGNLRIRPEQQIDGAIADEQHETQPVCRRRCTRSQSCLIQGAVGHPSVMIHGAERDGVETMPRE